MARAELAADEALVEVHARELGEAFVDRLGEVEDALRHLARRGDDDDHDEARLQGEDLDVADGGRRDGRRRHHGEQLGDARQRLRRLAQRVVDLAARPVALDGRREGAASRRSLDDARPRSGGSRRRWARAPRTCGDGRACPAPRGPPGRCGWWTARRPASKRSLRCLEPTGAPEAMYSSMTARRTRSCRAVSATFNPLNAYRETGVRTPRWPRTAPFASRGLYHCAGKPIQPRRARRRPSRRTPAERGERHRQPAARREQQALAGEGDVVEDLDLAGRVAPSSRAASQARRAGRVAASAAPTVLDGPRAEAQVGTGAPVRHVVARPSAAAGRSC